MKNFHNFIINIRTKGGKQKMCINKDHLKKLIKKGCFKTKKCLKKQRKIIYKMLGVKDVQ